MTDAQTHAGMVHGNSEGDWHVFRTIPYATAAHRFAPPAPVQPWAGTRDTNAPVELYPQPGAAGVESSELSLSVWSPREENEAGYPVMIWVHGGGWEVGNRDIPSPPAHRGIVIVTVSYRVGAAGWLQLAHHGGRLRHASNLGLQDQLAAIDWANENITAFGGDPRRVTLVGESAGGFSIGSLMAVRTPRKFRGVGMFSGAASRVIPLQRAQDIAVEVLEHLGVLDHPEEILDVSPEALIDAQSRAITQEIGARNGASPLSFGTVDDRTVPTGVLARLPLEAFAAADAGFRVLGATTRDEGASFAESSTWMSPATVDELAENLHSWGIRSPEANTLARTYTAEAAGDPDLARQRILTDWMYRLSTARTVVAASEAGADAALLLVDRVADEPAVHGCDIGGILGTDPSRADVTGAVGALVRGEPWPNARAELGVPSIVTGDGRHDGAYRSALERWAGVPRP